MFNPIRGHVTAHLPQSEAGVAEEIVVLQHLAQGRIERIVSQGHASPPGFWYDQPEDEWVLVLQGAGTIAFAEEGSEVTLCAGDYLHIPAHCRHRVAWTDPHLPTIWLAVHSPPVVDENGFPAPAL